MICYAEIYATSGHHHHIATLQPGSYFQGIYLMCSPPTILAMDNEEYYYFKASDLTGMLQCMIPTHKVIWRETDSFKSQRLLILGKTISMENDVGAIVKTLQPVTMVW